MDFDEFCVIMEDLVKSADKMEGEMKEAFRLIDTDKDGRVSKSELRYEKLNTDRERESGIEMYRERERERYIDRERER